MALAQEGSSDGKLKLPVDLFGTGDTGSNSSVSSTASTTTTTRSGVTGAELPAAAPYPGSSASYSGGGMSYSQSLGTHLRAAYNTQSYGQAAGNLDLGTMLMHQDGDRALFLDGQITLNDETGPGFNLGVGARALVDTEFPMLGESQKILGVSLWADGSSTINDNFFPQIGLSGELLGDQWDFRANASFVLEDQTAFGDTVVGNGGVTYIGNALSAASLTGRDNAMHLTELEAARRIANREFWAFAGGYGLYGQDGVDTAGYSLGIRGYATPDLALQLKVTDDDLFATNTVFSITWFIGRTRTDTPFRCDLTDRLREPVRRNDYVAVYNDTISGAAEPLTFDLDGDGTTQEIRVVHVDSSAAAGGDGTFENPLQSLDDINANSQEFDIVLVHANSAFTNQTAVLQGNQRLLGEGNDIAFTTSTDQFGTLTLPETFDGASSATAPIITNTTADGVILAADNEVANLTITGAPTAIDGLTNGSGGANLHDLAINGNGTTTVGISLSPIETLDAGQTTIAMNATLDNITFDGVSGNDIAIDATAVADPTAANVTLQEAIAISNITSTNGGAASLAVFGTHDGGELTVDNYNWDGGTTGLIGMSFDSTGGTVDVRNSTLTGGAATAVGFDINQNTGTVAIGASTSVTNINGVAANIIDAEGAVDFAATVSNTTVDGGTVRIERNTGLVTVNGDITTEGVTSLEIIDAGANVTASRNITRNGTAGIAVAISDTNSADDDPNDGIQIQFTTPSSLIDSNDGSMAVAISGGDDEITFLSAIEDTGGIVVQDRTGGLVDFGGGVTTTTGANNAVTLMDNDDDSVVSFMDLDITTGTGRGFFANRGEVNVTGTSTIETTGASSGGLVLQATAANPITSTSGITFASIDTGNGSTDAVVLENVEGNVTVNGGTLNTAANAALQVTNATGVTLNDVELNGGGGVAATATYTNDTSNSLSLNTVEMNDGSLTATANTTAGGATTTVGMSSVTGAGAVALTNDGVGDLNASMTTVTGTTGAATSLDVNGAGDGSLLMTSVNTNGGTVSATSSVASSGDLDLTMLNSGTTNEFGAITVNDQGSGDVSASLSNVETNSTLDFDAAAGGTASLTVSGGAYNGAVTADATNGGTFTATINGGADLASTLDVNAGNTGVAIVSVGGASTIDGAVNLTASNTGTATITVNGGTVIDDLLNVTTSNTGTSTVNVNGAGTTVNGATTINANTVGTANVNLGGTFGDQVAVNANNSEDFNFDMSTATVTAGAAASALDLTIADTVNNATVDFQSNTLDSAINLTADNSQSFDLRVRATDITTGSNHVAFNLQLEDGPADADILLADSQFTTNVANAFVFDNNGNTGQINFQLDNNDFDNSSVLDAAAVITMGAGTLDATIGDDNNGGAGNSFSNNGAGTVKFQLVAEATSTVNVLYNGNTHDTVAGQFEFDNTAGVTFNVFDLDNSDGDFTNSVSPTLTGGPFTEINTAPQTPSF
ncbi:beta strand repeat-containing protein [Posidoniimonas polymericola]|nr:hypothetical protein [Posidoniimonas polymericola]